MAPLHWYSHRSGRLTNHLGKFILIAAGCKGRLKLLLHQIQNFLHSTFLLFCTSYRCKTAPAVKPEQSYIFSHTNELYTGQILAGSCIDLDPVADLYEQRYAYNSAGLYSCRLACTGCCIALKARLCLSDLQLYKRGGSTENTLLL